MQYVSLIIPTYNEAKNLPLLVKEITLQIPRDIDIELIIVDDNSPDGTGHIADSLAKHYNLRVIHRSGKLGLGSAVREGFKLSSREYIGVMDADLSHDPEILPRLIYALKEYDIAIGSRFEKGSSVEQWPWARKLLSHVGIFLARQITPANDPLSGYFFMKRAVVNPQELTTTGYKILFEILIKGIYTSIIEFPYHFRTRAYSSSKLNYGEYVCFSKQLLEYALYKLKH